MGTNRINLTLGVLAMVALMSAGTAQAQKSQASHPTSPAWMQNMGHQLAMDIESPIEGVKEQSLKQAAYFAYFYGDQMDLKPALPNLLKVFRHDPSDTYRTLALAAIEAIGDEDAMAEVRRTLSMAPPQHPRLQLATIAALMNFYGRETFAGDRESAALAQRLVAFYSNPRVLIGPPVMVDIQKSPRM